MVNNELVKHFDKRLSEKASRNSLENFIIKADSTYASLEDQKLFQEIINEDMDEIKESVKKSVETLDMVGS